SCQQPRAKRKAPATTTGAFSILPRASLHVPSAADRRRWPRLLVGLTPPWSASPAQRGSRRRWSPPTTCLLQGHDATRVAPVLRRGGGGPALRVARAVLSPARLLEKSERICRPHDDIDEPADERGPQEEIR